MADERNNVETLEIKVVSNTKDATDGLAKLVGTLDKLKNVTKGNNGFDGLQKSLESITATASKLESGAILKLRSLAQGLKALGEVKISKTIEERLFNIGAAVDLLKDIDMTKLTELTGGLQTFSSVGNIKTPVPGNVSVPGTPAATASLPDISQTEREVQAAAETLEEGRSRFAAFADGARTAIGTVGLAFLKLDAQMRQFFAKHNISLRSIGSSIGRFLTAPFRKAKEEVTKFTGAFGRFFAMFKKRAMYRMINGIISAITDGFKTGTDNLYQYSKAINGPFADSMDRIATALLYFKNSIGAAVGPLINMLAPAIEYVTDKAVEFLNTINQLFARLSGASTWTKAIRYPKEYAEAADDAKKANEELKRTILGFDELNVLQDNKTKDSSKSKTADDYSKMFEEVALTAADNPFAGFFEPFKAAWDNEGQNTINSIKKAFGQVKELISTVGQTFAEVWKNGTGQEIIEKILRIWQNIFDTIGAIAERIKEAWNENDNGKRIVQGILDIFDSILGTIEDITKSTKEWAEKFDFGPLLESIANLLESIKPLVDDIGDSLKWVWDNIILPIINWAGEDVAPAAIDLISAAVSLLHTTTEKAKPVLEWLWENFFKPLGEWVGDQIVNALKSMTDLLNDLNDLLSGNTTFGEFLDQLSLGQEVFLGLATALGVLLTAFTAFAAVQAIISGVGAVIGALTSPIGIAIAAITALIVIGVELYKHWDEIVAWFKDIIDKAKEKISGFIKDRQMEWDGFKRFIRIAWQTFKKNVHEKVEALKSTVITIVEGVKKGVIEKFENIKSRLTDIWNGIKDAVKKPINAILGFVENMVNGVINGFNRMITALNALSFDVPEWVPAIGGKTFGFNLSTLQTITIPRLAEGGMVNAGTMFVAGEAGAEVVAQMGRRTGVMNTDEMRESVEQGLIGASNALGAAVASALIRANNQGVGSPVVEVTITADSETLYKAVRKGEQYYNNRYHVVAGV